MFDCTFEKIQLNIRHFVSFAGKKMVKLTSMAMDDVVVANELGKSCVLCEFNV